MMTEAWRLSLLGGLKAEQGDLLVARFHTRKTAVMLAYLAFFVQRAHPRDELIEMLWPETDPDQGRNRLRVALNALRKQLEPPGPGGGILLDADRNGVRLRPGAFVTDVADFERALRAGAEQGDGSQKRALLSEATALYRGDLLQGFDEEWILPERERLAESYRGALRALAAGHEGAGEPEQALDAALRLLATDPWQEASCLQVMRLYAALGRPGEALRHFTELEERFRQDFGEAPSAQAQTLAENLRRTRTALPRAHPKPAVHVSPPSTAPPQTAPPQTAPIRLPVSLTRLFGREADIAGLAALLRGRETRLLTLTGAGGAGKTRLSLEAARAAAGAFPGGIFFIPLADLHDPALLADAIGDAMRLERPAQVGALQRVADALGAAPTLLVLDNFEHLIEPGASVLSDLLQRVPTLTCLVSSRQALGVSGEREWTVFPLPTPDAAAPLDRLVECASVRLFVDRARGVRPDFAVTPRNAAAIAQICERLEGLPLSLELAAAWARVLTPAQMHSRLERPFEILVSRQKGAEERHQTLRAAIAWSFRLLPTELRRVFTRLSVFRGGWTGAAAEAVCEASQVWEALAQLQERSLVVAEDDGTEMRLRLLETIREFADEELGPDERDEARRRHAGFFLTWAETVAPKLQEADQAIWLDRLEADHDNLRAVFAWDRAQPGSEVGLRLGVALYRFWAVRGYLDEGRRRLTQALECCKTASEELQSKALNTLASLAYAQGDNLAAQSALEEALGLCRRIGDPERIGVALNNFGSVAINLGDFARAQAMLAESLDIRRELGEQHQIAGTLGNLGNAAMLSGDYSAALPYLEESLALFRDMGALQNIALTLNSLGAVFLFQERFEVSRRYFEESLAMRRQIADKGGIAASLMNLGVVAEAEGRYDEARTLLAESLTLRRELGHQTGIAESLECFARLAAARGEAARAARLYGAAEALRERLAAPLYPAERARHASTLAAVRQALGDVRFASAWALGRTLTTAQAVAFALETPPQ